MKKQAATKHIFTKSHQISAFTLGLLFAVLCGNVLAKDYLVNTQEQYKRTIKQLKPGDSIILANGVWSDFDAVFKGTGTKEKPISLTAQTKGKVILSGQSSLRLAGEHLVVSGLVFRDGYTPRSSVIAFRRNKQDLANYSRVTETVIDNFNNPERHETDYWVTMYGKHNRFDHNHLEGKRNKGVTMAVRLDSKASQENNHRIDHNYFGPRPILGSNGGETLRIGTSHYSLLNSSTLVENNYFDRCDGELEIISNKSGNNTFRGNVFFESRGTLTLRHGNGNLVEENIFFGNGVDHTGGIRVINKNQTVRNNYMEGLTGYRLGSAFTVMNGVPNSKINRYHQVDGALIENNTLVNSDHIHFAAGSDAERTAVPINSKFKNNLIYHQEEKNTVTVFDDISGISFSGNAVNRAADFPIKEGFESTSIEMQREKNGLLYPKNKAFAGVGIKKDIQPIAKDDTGVTWYPKPEKGAHFGTGKTIRIKPNAAALDNAIETASAGDVIAMTAGSYSVDKILVIDKPLSFFGAKANDRTVISFERPVLFEIADGGSLQLRNLTITGKLAPDNVGNAVVRTVRRAMLKNYEFVVEQCEIEDLDVNRSFNFFSAAKGTFADNIAISHSRFKNVTGAILNLNSETDDYGIYNAEYVQIEGSTFESIKDPIVNFYRGGTDESTFGPHFVISSSMLEKVGYGAKNRSQSSLQLHGVQVATLQNNQFIDSHPVKVFHTVGVPITKIIGNLFSDTALPQVKELNSNKANTALIQGNASQSNNSQNNNSQSNNNQSNNSMAEKKK